MSETLIQYHDGRESTISHESENESLVELTQAIQRGYYDLLWAVVLGYTPLREDADPARQLGGWL